MNPGQTIQSTMWAAIFIQTIGAIDPPGAGPRKLPAPGQYMSIFAVWTVLGFFANTALARGARAMSIVLLLVTIVLGPGGQRLISLMSSISGGVATGVGSTAGTVAPTAAGAAPVAPSPSATVAP